MIDSIPQSSVDVLKSALIYYLKVSGRVGRAKSRREFIMELHDWEGLQKYFPEWSESFDPYPSFAVNEKDEENTNQSKTRPKYDKGFPVTVAVLDNWITGQKQANGIYKTTTPSREKLLAISEYLKIKKALDKNWPEESDLYSSIKQLAISLGTHSIQFPIELNGGRSFVSEDNLVENYYYGLLKLRQVDSPGIIAASELIEFYSQFPKENIYQFLTRLNKHDYNRKIRVSGLGIHLSSQNFRFFVEHKNQSNRQIYTWELIDHTNTKRALILRKSSFPYYIDKNELQVVENFTSFYDYYDKIYEESRPELIEYKFTYAGPSTGLKFPWVWSTGLSEQKYKSIYVFGFGGSLPTGKQLTDRMLRAAEHGDVVALQAAIVAGADPNYQDPDSGITPLITASSNNAYMLTRYLIEVCEVDPLVSDQYGYLPSMCAEDERVISYLIDAERSSAEERYVDYEQMRLQRSNRPDPPLPEF